MGSQVVWHFLCSLIDYAYWNLGPGCLHFRSSTSSSYSTHSSQMMTTGYTLNRVNFTRDEETCILRFLNQARECGYPSGNSEWYSVIDSIIQKYYDSDIKEAQVACY